MATFEQAFYVPGQGYEVLKYLHLHNAMALKSVSKCCWDAVTKFANRLVPFFSYDGGTLTFQKKKTKTFKNCLSVGIKKTVGSDNYTLVIEKFIYHRGTRHRYDSDNEYEDYTDPFYERDTTQFKISESSAKNYIQAIKFLAHSIQKRCHQFDFHVIKLDFQSLPEVESESEQEDYPEYAQDDFDDYPAQNYYSFDDNEDSDLNDQYYDPYYDPSDPYYQSEQYTSDYNDHSKKTDLVMSELVGFFMNKLFE
jgi:hypothetical protein